MALAASLVATAASGVFAVRLGRRWLGAGRTDPALVAGTAALGMVFVASLMLLLGVVARWTPATFRTFYLFGAVLNVPWLAVGSVLVNRRDSTTSRSTGVVVFVVATAFVPGALRGDLLALTGAILGLTWATVLLDGDPDRLRAASVALVAVFTVAAAAVVLTVDLAAALPATGLPKGGELFPSAARGFAVGGNAIGSVVVVVGALVAVARLGGWRAPGSAGLEAVAVGNLLIAFGVTLVAASGGMFSSPGDTAAHAAGLGVGVVVMFAGFVRTSVTPGRARP